MQDINQKYMNRAIQLAYENLGKTSPNPSVGCVIVKNGEIISQAATGIGGSPHAEKAAIEASKQVIEGADIYVTLEPCSHRGKNLPCVDFVIAGKPARVIIANRDPNPLVDGKGIKRLRENNIEVVEDFLKAEAFEINKYFFKRITQNIPYITCKIAASLDGKIALSNKQSKWITGSQAREKVQETRLKADAIITGTGTIISDDPSLNVRINGEEEFSPIKFIIDKDLKTPETSKIFNNGKVYIFSSKNIVGKYKNAEIILIEENQYGSLSLRHLCEKISQLGLSNLIIEAGSGILTSFLKEGLIDEIMLFSAPKILGAESQSFISNLNLHDIPENNFKAISSEVIGDDVLTIYRNINSGLDLLVK